MGGRRPPLKNAEGMSLCTRGETKRTCTFILLCVITKYMSLTNHCFRGHSPGHPEDSPSHVGSQESERT